MYANHIVLNLLKIIARKLECFLLGGEEAVIGSKGIIPKFQVE